MILNMVGAAKGQEYDSGDTIQYPVSNIPQGTVKLYTEQNISNIGTALRTILNDRSLSFTPAEMSNAVLSIPQGANDVWIGSQLSYDQLGTYIATTAYIIFENNHILKVYSGDVPIYVEPINWDYVLMNESITANRVIDSRIEIQGSDALSLGWEYIFHANNFQQLFNNGFMLMNCCSDTGPTRQSTAAGGTWKIGMNIWVAVEFSYPATDNPYLYYRAHKDPGDNLIYIYQRDLEDNETYIGTYAMNSAIGAGNTIQIGFSGWSTSIFYLEAFKFRWIT